MVEESRQVLVGALPQHARSRFGRQDWIGVEGEMPVGVGELEGLVQQVDQVQQPVAARLQQQAGVTERVTSQIDNSYARRYFIAGADEAKAVMQRCEKVQMFADLAARSEADQRPIHSSHSACVVM